VLELGSGNMTDRLTPDQAQARNLACHEDIVEAIRTRQPADELLHPDFHMEGRNAAATDHAYVGARGLREWRSDIFEAFIWRPGFRAEEIIAAGPDYVVACFCVAGRSVRTKDRLEVRWYGVTWFANGKATRAVGFATRREALEAVALTT
jgi:hypothetical protein